MQNIARVLDGHFQIDDYDREELTVNIGLSKYSTAIKVTVIGVMVEADLMGIIDEYTFNSREQSVHFDDFPSQDFQNWFNDLCPIQTEELLIKAVQNEIRCKLAEYEKEIFQLKEKAAVAA